MCSSDLVVTGSQVKQAWFRYCTAFAGLNPRERVLVTVLAIMVVALALYSLAIDPALRGSRRVAAQIELQRKALQSIQSDTAKLVASNTDPDAPVRERIAQANQRIQLVEEALRASRQGLVLPENMPQLLESLLHRSRGLKVISFRTLPTAALMDRPRTPEGPFAFQRLCAAWSVSKARSRGCPLQVQCRCHTRWTRCVP